MIFETLGIISNHGKILKTMISETLGMLLDTMGKFLDNLGMVFETLGMLLDTLGMVFETLGMISETLGMILSYFQKFFITNVLFIHRNIILIITH